MGQTHSDAAAEEERSPEPAATASEASPPSSPPSLEALVAEATASSNDDNESLDEKARKALDCPCVADLRKGPCGTQFSEAFVCFIKSTSEEKGSDCVNPFIALQNCIKANPDAFSKDVLQEESNEKEEEVQDYKIIPPSWAKEPKPKI